MSSSHTSDDDHESESDIPLHKLNVPAGLHRSRVNFVPEGFSPEPTIRHDKGKAKMSIADFYMDTVLSKTTVLDLAPAAQSSPSATPSVQDLEDPSSSSHTVSTCKICNATVDQATGEDAWKKHNASMVHQLALPHSFPPSALDRSRMGVNYLTRQGWDMDARRGLGASGQGTRIPVKPKGNVRTQGLGFTKTAPPPSVVTDRVVKPKQLTKAEKLREERRKAARAAQLHQEFYASDDVLKYLGGHDI